MRAAVGHKRDEAQAEQGQLPVEQRHEDRRRNDHHDDSERLDQSVLNEHADTLDIRESPRHELPGMDAVMEAETEGLQLVEIDDPQTVRDALTQRFAKEHLNETERASQCRNQDHQQSRVQQQAINPVPVVIAALNQREGLVDALAEQLGDEQEEDRRNRCRQRGSEEMQLVLERQQDDAPDCA